jgi:DNA polymerase
MNALTAKSLTGGNKDALWFWAHTELVLEGDLMKIICLDFETYFDSDYSLSRMTTEAYVRDPRFAVNGAALKLARGDAPQWFAPDQLKAKLHAIDWNDTATIMHHAHFDGLILSHHFGIVPRHYFCTLSMARLLVGNHLGLSLDALAQHFELGSKSAGYLTIGKHWYEMTSWEQSALAEGAKHDVNLTWQLFSKLMPSFPAEEFDVVDMTVRMFTEPKLIGDQKLLAEIWTDEDTRHRDLWARLGVEERQLRSNDLFAELLAERGVEVQYKDGKNGSIPAVAKNDQFLLDLLENEDEEIALLAAARRDCKSSLVQSRAATIGNMAMRGPLAIYLQYCGAHTTRWSGGDGANFQNLRRGSQLRKSIKSPEKYLLAVPDQSQIECRLLNYLAGQHDIVDKFRQGHDPYAGIASYFYNRAITAADKPERGTGKQAELSCGYGCGGAKFQRVAKVGTYGPPVDLSLSEATRFVNLYRGTHPAVVRYWRTAEGVLSALAGGKSGDWGPLRFENGCIYLPNGAPLLYQTLNWHTNEQTGEVGWRRKTRNGWDRMYGAKLVEQTTQALARLTAAQAMLRIRKAGFSVVGCSHDEAWVLVPDDGHSAEAAEYCRREMMQVPEWLPGIPLDAEISVGRRYEK